MREFDAAIDAISAHTCVIDAHGVIISVNKAWRRFDSENRQVSEPDPHFVGANYISICDSAKGDLAREAGPMAEGIRNVASGMLEEFYLEYPCHSPTERRWFMARVNRFDDSSGRLVVVHENITERKEAELKLLASEQRFRHFFENNTSVMLLVSPDDGQVVNANKSACEFYGYSRDALLALRISDINMLSREEVEKEMQRASDEHCNFFNFRHRVGSGDIRDVEVYSTPTEVDGRKLLFSTIYDVTERRAAEANLKLAASVFLHAREGIMITDSMGVILNVNETFTRITGFLKEDVLGKRPNILSSGRQTPEMYATLWRSLTEKQHWYGEMWNRHKSGALYAVLQTISAVCDESGQVRNYVSLMTDITAMKEHEHELEHVAHYDALTQLPNRVLLFDRLQQAIIRSQREKTSIAVAFMDLDGFKSVNDRHGHNVGDTLLIEVAQRVKGCLRDGDTLARIGGDEFVAILADLPTGSDYEPVIRRMLEGAAHPVQIGEATLSVSASIGVTLFPQDGVGADLLLRHADQAMYEAKQAGKNRHQVFDISYDSAEQAKRGQIERIQQAIVNQELQLFYQPKVDLKTFQVVGWEALLRWMHPEKGLLGPMEFLHLVNDHPISIQIGEWVTQRAFEDMVALQAIGINHPISVNIGARELRDGHLIERLQNLLTKYPEVRADSLQLEVLESTALDDVTKVSSLMRACKEIGVSFALDDFGTGYSSLTYLKHLPAETLKVDMSFVRGMTSDATDRAIVEGVIGLARAFGKEVIAEGVETAHHAELLKQLGCDVIQGYGISAPMRFEEMLPWLIYWDMHLRKTFFGA